MFSRPQILLTGASGVVGSVLATELAPQSHLTCLTRRRPARTLGVRQLRGDLTAPSMGLAARDLADVLARTEIVVHCGALTSFANNPDVAMQVNRVGTERILDLTERAGARLVHVSTAFVARAEEFGESAAENPGERVRSPKSYLRSKVAAEEAVLASGLPVAVVRPSVLMGDSFTGHIQQFQGWHMMCQGIITGGLPFLPAGGESLVDCVPVDFAARAIAALALSPAAGEWWLTAGPDAFSLGTCIDLCLGVAAERGLAPHRPRALPREMVERLVLPAFGQTAPPALRRQMAEGLELMRLFGSEHRFPSRWPTMFGTPAATQDELIRCFEASVHHLCDVQGLGGGREIEVA